MIPMQSLSFKKDSRKNGEYDKSDRFLNDFQLHQ